jgi:hypothetical protein
MTGHGAFVADVFFGGDEVFLGVVKLNSLSEASAGRDP